ncbi:MAG: hypothetical protein M3270_11550 [Thermoproteota archaeon]|nr:hypothetical protein [Thermoproteota archaeon]
MIMSNIMVNYYYYYSEWKGITNVTPIIGVLGTIIVWGIDLFWYIPYYTRDKSEKYFSKIGLVQAAAIEYQFSRKLLNITALISIFSILGPILDFYFITPNRESLSLDKFAWLIYIIPQAILYPALFVYSFATIILA